MKPCTLTIKNIGPFVGEHHIDFSNLDNIYVITGKTGSGKTTILDCITYALYGKLPGARSNADRRYLRSDFCSSKDTSSIFFEFMIHEIPYRVERTLPISKITRKGTQSEESESAILYRIEKKIEQEQSELFFDDSHLTVLESQKSKVDTMLHELLSLTIDEFSRIVLLPQGEFATFLRQNSNDRKKLLAKLFPVEQFEIIAERIKEERTKFEISLKEILLRLEHISSEFNPENAHEEIKNLEKKESEAKGILESLQKNLTDLHAQKEKLLELEKKLKQFKSVEKEIQELEQQKNNIDELEVKIKNSLEAEKIEPISNNYSMYSNELEKNEQELHIAKEEHTKAVNEIQNLQAEEKELKVFSQRLSQIEVLLHDLERCLGIQQNIEMLEKKIIVLSKSSEEGKDELQTIQENNKDFVNIINNEQCIQENFESTVQKEKSLLHELLLCNDASLRFIEVQANEAFNSAKRILDDMILQNEKEKQLNIASNLADFLEEGKECPVCGSMNHPNPTKVHADLLDMSEKIAMQEKVVTQTESDAQSIQRERYTLAGAIEESKKNIANAIDNMQSFATQEECIQHKTMLEETLHATKELHAENEKNITKLKEAKEKVAVNEKIISSLQEKENALQIQIVAAKTELDGHTKELTSVLQNINGNKTSVEHTIVQLQHEKNQLAQKVENFHLHKKNIENKELMLSEQIAYIEKSILTNTENKERTFLILSESIKNSYLFNNKKDTITTDDVLLCITTIKEALMDDAKRQKEQEKIATFKSEGIRLQTLHTQLKEDLLESEEDVETKQVILQERIDTLTADLSKEQESFSQLQHRLLQLDSFIKDYDNTEARRKEVSAEYEKYSKLHKVISGDNQKKVSLDAWVLAMHLQEIIVFANSRLQRMSNNRYQLYLKDDAEGGNAYKGLDIEIYDDYTGKSRPTATLSGGETFITSISLALAISDMVQARNGGVQLDSLFIDEGFGSLDPESLEKALGILDEIRETRSVALISHVETLQTRIPSQIRITKNTNGSTISISSTL